MIAWAFVLASVLLGPIAAEPSQPAENAEYIRLMNVGKAFLENRDSAKAIEAYAAARKLQPKTAAVLRNLARSNLLARGHEQALDLLTQAAATEPDSAATAYLTGLTLMRLSRFDDAVAHLEKAVRLDPDIAALRFQLASAYQATQQHEKAHEQLLETVRLDPLHASAHFKLSTYARQAGDREGFQQRTREFMRLRKIFGDETRSPEALERCLYADAEVPRDADARPAATPAATPIRVRFENATKSLLSKAKVGGVSAVCVLEVDALGRAALFVVDRNNGASLLRLSDSGVLQEKSVDVPLPDRSTFQGCAAGDFFNEVPEGQAYDPIVHAHNDVVLWGPDGVCLLERIAPAGFRDVTKSAGLDDHPARKAHWIDFEHDGDLDLLLARESGLELWQNNGNRRFQDVSKEVGLGPADQVVDVASADLDRNVAIDLVAAQDAGPTIPIINQRTGMFGRLPDPPGPWPAARRIVVNDVNNDGRPDVGLVRDDGIEWRSIGGPAPVAIRVSDMKVAAATLMDFDNDGWLDVCLAGSSNDGSKSAVVQLFRQQSVGAWRNVSSDTRLASATDGIDAVRAILAVDVDADHDTDLVLLTEDGALNILRNVGGHENGQVKIRLPTIKTNPTGFGVHLELRDGAFFVSRDVTDVPIEIGLSGRRHFDTIQTVWANGVVDNQIDVTVTEKPLEIVERNVATGSCPFLYAWDGTRFRFVTDLLGNSPIGLPLSRDTMLPADPDEIVYVGDTNVVRSHNDRYRLVITDEFREVLYLDEARLLAVDHPSDGEIHSTDKIMPPPFPPSEVWFLNGRTPLRSTESSDGIDRTDSLRTLDGRFAPPGPPLPAPYRGMCHPMSIVLDFGPLDVNRPLVLAMTGWLQYGDGSTNIALSQNTSLTIIPPTLEAETPDGAWVQIDVVVGMPAGKTKTILCDLIDKLPPDTQRLRLSTTFEIRWDRIALFDRGPLPADRIRDSKPARAELAWRGFSKIRSRAPGHPTTPDFDATFDRPVWRTALAGWCTRYGDVRELVDSRDDRVVIMNAGDALTLEFDVSALPAIPYGMTRSILFYSVGWDKDGDHNVVAGDTVDPLPRNDPASPIADFEAATDWQLHFNTRWVPPDRFAPMR